jgi:hypothetical protein
MRGMEEETTQQQAAVDGDHRFVGSGLITRPSNASAAGSPFLDVNQLSQTSVVSLLLLFFYQLGLRATFAPIEHRYGRGPRWQRIVRERFPQKRTRAGGRARKVARSADWLFCRAASVAAQRCFHADPPRLPAAPAWPAGEAFLAGQLARPAPLLLRRRLDEAS